MMCYNKSMNRPKKAKESQPKKFKSKDVKEIKNSPFFKHRLILSIVVFIVLGVLTVVFCDSHAYWSIISAIIILVSAEATQISKRSILQLIGAFIGFFAGAIIASFGLGPIGNTLFLVLGAILVVGFLPAKRYALGSAGIGLVIVALSSLSVGEVSWDIIWQRLLWTIVGAVIVLLTVYVDGKLCAKKLSEATKAK